MVHNPPHMGEQWSVLRRQHTVPPHPMSPPVDPVQSDTRLPQRAAVVIVGGGIIGTTTALFLAEKGHAVVLCEKGRIGGEQSSRNWGWCRTMGRDAREIPLAIESLRLWRGMNARLDRDTGFRQAGIAYLCETEKEVAAQEAWLADARQYQVDARLLRGAAIDALVPDASSRFVAALHTPTDGRAEPSQAAPAIAEAARAVGATVLTDCAVRGIETKAGRISGVVTEQGRIGCDSVVLAGGAWSRLFCGNAGIDLPQLKVLGSVFRTAPLNDGPEITASGSVFAFRKRLDGGYTIARRNANIADITPELIPPAAALRSGAETVLWRDPPSLRPALFRGMAHETPLVARRAHTLRGRARAGPRPAASNSARGAHRAVALLSGIRANAGR